jgi:lipopolysaccharide export system permease protein
MPRILYRYLLAEIMPPFGASLLGLTCIVFLGQMMKVTQLIVVKGVGLAEVLKTSFFMLPYLLTFTLPMAATVGILLALTRLSVDHEVIALKTAGLSHGQVLPPVLGFAAAVAMLTLSLTLYGSPWGKEATRELLKEVAKRRADLGITEQVFNTDFHGMTLFVNQVAPKTGEMQGIFVYDFRDEDNPHTIYASRGQLSFDQAQETMLMHLGDGRVIRWDKHNPSRWHTVEFRTYLLPLQLFNFSLKTSKSETEMSVGELRATMAQNLPGSQLYNRAAVELNQRLAMPLGALLLCLMAMPLGLRPGRHGRTWGLVLGLVLFLVYYVIFTASWRLAVHAAINPRVAPWLADLVFVGLAAYLWRRTVQERPLLPESWLVWGRHWNQKVIALTKKIISLPNNR